MCGGSLVNKKKYIYIMSILNASCNVELLKVQ